MYLVSCDTSVPGIGTEFGEKLTAAANYRSSVIQQFVVGVVEYMRRIVSEQRVGGVVE